MSSEYWKSPIGIKRRVELFADDYTFSSFNDTIQAYGETNKVSGYEWFGSIDERTCPDCDSGIGTRYGLGDSLPSLPLHAGCRCTLELITY